MINLVKDGIIGAIAADFPGIPIYDEPVPQGLVEPSFSVRCVTPSLRHFRGRRYYENNLYEVVYFPPEENRYRDSNDTIDKLYLCLEVITLPDGTSIRGRDMHPHTADDSTVVFTVRYSDYMYRETEQALMETLDASITPGAEQEMVYPLMADEAQQTLTEERAELIADGEQIPERTQT